MKQLNQIVHIKLDLKTAAACNWVIQIQAITDSARENFSPPRNWIRKINGLIFELLKKKYDKFRNGK